MNPAGIDIKNEDMVAYKGIPFGAGPSGTTSRRGIPIAGGISGTTSHGVPIGAGSSGTTSDIYIIKKM